MSTRFKPKYNIKKGDTVVVITGEDKDVKKPRKVLEVILDKAKVLVELPDVTKSFRELQLLHRVWKEEIGPVDKENREKIWQEFSEITKILHDKREALASQFKEKEQENRI